MNAIPYYILAILSVSCLIGLIRHQRSGKPLVLTLAFAGMVYFFEFFVLLLFDAYVYEPNILAVPYYDNALGAVFSNLLAVPVAAAFVGLYRLRMRWLILITLGFGGVQWLFVRLAVFKEHWWNIGYTLIGIFLFLLLARWWIGAMGKRRSVMFLSLHMLAWSIVATLVFALAVTQIRLYHVGWFVNRYRDDLAVSAVFSFLKAGLLAWAVYRFESPWIRAGSLLVVFAANFALLRLDIIRLSIPVWQYWLIYVPCCAMVLWLIALSYRSLRRLAAG